MSWLSSLLTGLTGRRKPGADGYTLRDGKSVPVDEAFLACASGDLDRMIKAARSKTNPIDRHFLLQSIVAGTYKRRKEPKCRRLCIEFSGKHLSEFPDLAPALRKDMGGTLPRISTFQHYATVLTEDGEFDKAIAVCEQALAYGLHDNTQSGYEGRIQRIRKKAQQRS